MYINKKAIIGIILTIILLVGVGVAVYLSRQEQDPRQRASEPTACSLDQPTDTILLYDRSGSMLVDPASPTDSTKRYIPAMKAANTFIDLMAKSGSPSGQHKLGLVAFAGNNPNDITSRIVVPLTTTYSTVKTEFNKLLYGNLTCLDCGAKLVDQDFTANGRAGVKKVVVLMTDGTPTITSNSQTEVDKKTAEDAAMASFIAGYKKHNYTIYAVGFGDDVNEAYLKKLAADTGGKYYYTPDANNLSQILTEISTLVGKGSVQGKAFHDENSNKIQDANEVILPGRTIKLNKNTGENVSVTTTDDQGLYAFPGLCDGSYEVSQELPPGWVQTLPENNTPHVAVITKGATLKNLDLGSTTTACIADQGKCEWSSVTGATSYTYKVTESVGTTTQGGQVIKEGTVAAPTTVVTFVAHPDRTYTCTVTAQNNCGVGPAGEASATCAAPPTPTPTMTPTPIPTGTPTPTPTATPTPTPTPLPTATPTPRPTNTPVPTTPPPPVVVTPTPTPIQIVQQPTTPTPTMAESGSPLQTVTLIGGLVLTTIGAIVFFLL